MREFSIGRINCRHYKHQVCDRLVQNRKFPMFVILHQDKVYDFFKGNLTIDYISKHLKTKEFIERADSRLSQFDQEGLTFKNMKRHPVYNILPLYRSGETKMDGLKR